MSYSGQSFETSSAKEDWFVQLRRYVPNEASLGVNLSLSRTVWHYPSCPAKKEEHPPGASVPYQYLHYLGYGYNIKGSGGLTVTLSIWG